MVHKAKAQFRTMALSAGLIALLTLLLFIFDRQLFSVVH